MWLKFGIRILLKILREHPNAKVALPTAPEVGSFQESVGSKYPYLNEVWGTCDGLNLNLEQSGDIKIQRIFYNGWKHSPWINAPEGIPGINTG